MAKIVEEIILKVSVNDKAVTGGLKRINKQTKRVTKSADLMKKALKFAGGVIIGKGLLEIAKSAAKVSEEFERLNNAMLTVFKTQKEVAEQMEFLRDTSSQLGTNLLKSATGYAQLAASAEGAGISSKTVQETFTAVSKASAALSLTGEQTKSVFRALSQIMSKGRLSAEELRQQLGEALPGAFTLAADSLGLTTTELDKFLELGLITAEDFMPRFARAMDEKFTKGALANAQGALAQTNRNVNEFNEVLKGIGDVTRDVTISLGGEFLEAWRTAAQAIQDLVDVYVKYETTVLGTFGAGNVKVVGIPGVTDDQLDKEKSLFGLSEAWDKLMKKAKEASVSVVEDTESIKKSLAEKGADKAFGAFEKGLTVGDRSEEIRMALGVTEETFNQFSKAVKTSLASGLSFDKVLERAQDAVKKLDKSDFKVEFDVKVNAKKTFDALKKDGVALNSFLKDTFKDGPLKALFGVITGRGLGEFEDIAGPAAAANLGPVEAIEAGTARGQAFLARPSDSIEQINKDQLVVQKEQKDILGRIEKNQTVIKVQGL